MIKLSKTKYARIRSVKDLIRVFPVPNCRPEGSNDSALPPKACPRSIANRGMSPKTKIWPIIIPRGLEKTRAKSSVVKVISPGYVPEAERRMNDIQISWVDHLLHQSRIKQEFNTRFFSTPYFAQGMGGCDKNLM